jgi:membrane protein
VAEQADRLVERSLEIAARTRAYAPALATVRRDQRHAGGLLAGALAFRLFGALLPLALLVALALGYAETVDRTATEKAGESVGIAPVLLSSVAESSKLSAGTRWTVAVFTLFALLWSAMSAARAIRGAHSVAWTGGVQPLGRAVAAGLVLICATVGLALVWGAVGWARAHFGVAGALVTVAAGLPFFAIWLGVSTLLPHADAPRRALVPGAVLVAVGIGVIYLGTVLFVAGRVERASATYGSFGVAFTILVWLYVVSRVIVGSAMLNAALWERRRGDPTR